MLATAIIVFREVLEAALIVGIVLAASRGIAHRGAWVAGGIAAGVIGAMLVAAGAETIAAAAAGMGQELFNAAILLAAVAMLGWHNIWMTTHGREMAVAANRLGSEVREGARPLWALALVVGLAVLREGSEVVLFLYGIAATGGGRGRHGAGRRARRSGRRDGRGGALFRAGQHPAAPSVRRHRLDGSAACRRYGGAGRRLSGAGRSGAVARQSSCGTPRSC